MTHLRWLPRCDECAGPTEVELVSVRRGRVNHEAGRYCQRDGEAALASRRRWEAADAKRYAGLTRAEREREHMSVCSCGGAPHGPCFTHDEEGHFGHHHID